MTTSLTVPAVDKSPPYAQIAAYYRDRISNGEIRVGDLLPTNRQLVKEWNVSTHTIQGAMRVLREEKLIQTRPAKAPLVIAVPRP